MRNLVLQGQGKQPLSFSEIYKTLDNSNISPRRAFVQRIAKITKRSETTVYNWISGKFQPDLLAQEKIEEELNIPADILFPKTSEVNL